MNKKVVVNHGCAGIKPKRIDSVFFKRPIIQIPCEVVGCKIVLYSRTPNKKYCNNHRYEAKMGRLAVSNRKKNSIAYKGVYRLKHDEKVCLKCDKKFESFGKYHRICDVCNEENLEVRFRPRRLHIGKVGHTSDQKVIEGSGTLNHEW